MGSSTTGARSDPRSGIVAGSCAVAIFPDGQHAVSGSADGTLKCGTSRLVPCATLPGHQGFVTSVALFPGARLGGSTSKTGRCGSGIVARAEAVMSFTGDGELRTCVVTPDGTTVVAGEDSVRADSLPPLQLTVLHCRRGRHSDDRRPTRRRHHPPFNLRAKQPEIG